MAAGHGTGNAVLAAVHLARPVNLAIVAVAVVAGGVVAAGWPLPTGRALLGIAVACLATAAGNTLNDVVDRDVDARAHPDRPLPSGDLSPRTALWLAGGEYLAAFALAWFLPLPAFVLALLNGATLGAYEAGLKRRGLAGNAAISYLVGSVFLFGALAVAPGRAGAALVLFLLAFLANLSREVVKDVQDMRADVGTRRTLPMVAGRGNALAFAGLSLVLAVVLSPIPLWLGLGSAYLSVVGADVALLVAVPLMWRDPGEASTMIKAGMLLGIVAFLAGAVLGPPAFMG